MLLTITRHNLERKFIMNISLNTKFIKIVVAALALITTSATVAPTTITNLTTVSAKAKKHHKKVKKTKKKAYVIAKYYDEFKPGYSYTYNKKKGVFIGHKTKKHQSTTTDSDEPKVEQATSTYDVPKVKEFNKDIIANYNLEGDRWSKTNITVNIQALTNEQQQIAKGAIDQINNLGIINLTITNKKANITIVSVEQNNTALGKTRVEDNDYTYKKLNLIETTKVQLYNPTILNHSHGNYALELNKTILHELGHALGLDHTHSNVNNIMNPSNHTQNTNTIDSTHAEIDQDYINGLAILYQN